MTVLLSPAFDFRSDQRWERLTLTIRSFMMRFSSEYRIYLINRPGRLLNFWTLRVGAYLRWALIRGWALIKFSPFSASEVFLFILQQNSKC